jgi:LPS-assembly protein
MQQRRFRAVSILALFVLLFMNGFGQIARAQELKNVIGKGFDKPDKKNKKKSNLKASDLNVAADNISRDYDTRTLYLQGHVKIIAGDDKLSCDKAKVELNTMIVTAEGHIVLDSPEAYVEGEKIVYNYNTKLGEITQGMVESGNVIFVGDYIERLSDTKFLAKNATFSACTTCPEAWSFSGTEIEAEIGAYAYIKYPILRIVDFPVLILPRLVVPLKSNRQSGLLVPNYQYSSDSGSSIGIPYFWAISKNQDATFTLRDYTLRGLKESVEYRYMLGEHSKGKLNIAYLNDQAYNVGFIDYGPPTSPTPLPPPGGNPNAPYQTAPSIPAKRGFLTYEHYYDLPNNYIHRANLNLTSDIRYPRDFTDELPGLGDAALQNSQSITKNSDDNHFSVETMWYTNLLQSGGGLDTRDAVNRLPEINYSFIDHEIGKSNVFFRFDMNYINFARRNSSYDEAYLDTNGNRTATPLFSQPFTISTATTPGSLEDQIRTGQRLRVTPTFSYPFHLGPFVDVNPSISYQDTEYEFNATPETPIANYNKRAEVQIVEADISFKTKYSAVYGVDDGKSNRYKHEIEPELIYSRTPWLQKPNNIFFGNFQNQPFWRKTEALSMTDFTGPSKVQFDYDDRYIDENVITWVLSNYLIRKRYLKQPDGTTTADYFKFFTFRVSQSYDINQTLIPAGNVPGPHPWSTLSSLLDVRLDHFETHTTLDYYPYAQVGNFTTRVRFMNDMKNFIEVSYDNNAIVNEETNSATQQVTQDYGIGLGFKTKYLDFVGRRLFSLVSNSIETYEFIANAKFPGDCLVLSIGEQQNVGSDTRFSASLNFNFGG